MHGGDSPQIARDPMASPIASPRGDGDHRRGQMFVGGRPKPTEEGRRVGQRRGEEGGAERRREEEKRRAKKRTARVSCEDETLNLARMRAGGAPPLKGSEICPTTPRAGSGPSVQADRAIGRARPFPLPGAVTVPSVTDGDDIGLRDMWRAS